MKKLLIAAGVAVLAILIGWAIWRTLPNSPKAGAHRSATTHARVVKLGALRLYPNPAYTPGAVLTTDARVVCLPGYTARVRHVTRAQRRRIFARYGIAYPPKQGAYELDHHIPLELGGNNDDENLWPEPADPTPGFHQKDLVENYLHREVCAGHMSLVEAQREIADDWYAVYARMNRQ